MHPRVFLFVLHADPDAAERLGAALPDGRLVDLQAAHVSMHGRTSPLLTSPAAFRAGGDAARGLAATILTWVDSQRAPGTHLPPDRARVLREV